MTDVLIRTGEEIVKRCAVEPKAMIAPFVDEKWVLLCDAGGMGGLREKVKIYKECKENIFKLELNHNKIYKKWEEFYVKLYGYYRGKYDVTEQYRDWLLNELFFHLLEEK